MDTVQRMSTVAARVTLTDGSVQRSNKPDEESPPQRDPHGQHGSKSHSLVVEYRTRTGALRQLLIYGNSHHLVSDWEKGLAAAIFALPRPKFLASLEPATSAWMRGVFEAVDKKSKGFIRPRKLPYLLYAANMKAGPGSGTRNRSFDRSTQGASRNLLLESQKGSSYFAEESSSMALRIVRKVPTAQLPQPAVLPRACRLAATSCPVLTLPVT